MRVSLPLRFAASVSLALLTQGFIPAIADSSETQALEKAAAATENAPHYRMTMIITDKRGVHTNTLEYVRPDRRRVRLNDGKVEMIFVGKTTYMTARGRTIRLPGDRSESLDQMRPSLTKEMLQKATVKRIGAEVVDNLPTTVYEVTYNDSSHQGAGKYWVSSGDNLIRRLSGTSETTGERVMGKTVSGKSAYTATVDYKVAVEINLQPSAGIDAQNE